MLNIISLGAGVQSSTMALMAAHGEITPMPDCAIFADTQAEPKAIYDWLDWLETKLPFPVHRVSKGDLGADFIKALGDKKGRCGQPPFFVKNTTATATATAGVGILWRKCTQEYKLQPIRQQVRRVMVETGEKRVQQWIGISSDEAQRMKPSDVKFIDNIYPLVDRNISRRDCLSWMKANG